MSRRTLEKLRTDLQQIAGKKHQTFAELRPLIKKIAATYAAIFPNFKENINGSHYVYHFGVEALSPFTIIKEHGKRDCQNPTTAKRAILAIEDTLDYVELAIPDDKETMSEGDHGDERIGGSEQEVPETLPGSKLPDGDN